MSNKNGMTNRYSNSGYTDLFNHVNLLQIFVPCFNTDCTGLKWDEVAMHFDDFCSALP